METTIDVKLLMYIKDCINDNTPQLTEEKKNEIEAFISENKKYINYRDENGYTALYYSVIANKEIIVDLLIENGADLNYQYGSSQKTVLMITVSKNYKNCFYSLRRNEGVRLDIQDKNGGTAIMRAIKRNQGRCGGPNDYFFSLYYGGANITLKNLEGKTLFDFAYEIDDYYTVVFLMNKCGHLLNLNSYQLDQAFTLVLMTAIYRRARGHYVDCATVKCIQTLIELGTPKRYIPHIICDMAEYNFDYYMQIIDILFTYYTFQDITRFEFFFSEKEIYEKFKNTSFYRSLIENGFDETQVHQETSYNNTLNNEVTYIIRFNKK